MKYSRNTATANSPQKVGKIDVSKVQTISPKYAMPKTFYVSDRAERNERVNLLVMESNYNQQEEQNQLGLL